MSDKKSKVSVLIAVYNGHKTIEKAITSFINQTYSDKELIVIDGGSDDGTQEILKKYDQKIEYWESKPDHGIYHAWNKAVAHASGDWLCFIGADDYWFYPDAIKDLVYEGERTNTELVSGKVAIVDAHHHVKREYGKAWEWKKIKRHHCIAHPGMMHHKNCFERNGAYNEKFKIAGDYDFSLRLGGETRASYIDRVFVCMGNAGLSHTMIRKALSEAYEIQAAHPEIGPLKAKLNFIRTLSIVRIKILLGIF